MIRSAAISALVSAATLTSLAPSADGHISLLYPTSRQIWLTPLFQDSPFDNYEFCSGCYNAMGPRFIRPRAKELTDPAILAEYGDGDYFPLRFAVDKGEVADNGNYLERDEIAVRHGVCGDPSQAGEDGVYKYSTPNKDWPVLTTYRKGQRILIEPIMTAHHWGHLEFFICDTDSVKDGEDKVMLRSCFNEYPLDRAKGDDENSPIDPNYPGRYIVEPECRGEETNYPKPEDAPSGYIMRMNYMLPENLTCKRCILLMVYYAGVGCLHPGYSEFNPSSWPSKCAPNKEDWINDKRHICGTTLTYPQEFFACSDISITDDGRPLTNTVTVTTSSGENDVIETDPEPEPEPECENPSGAYEQCGGVDFDGSSCCREGFECVSHGDCYAQCEPIEGACADSWKQCGGYSSGAPWRGSTCCWPGATCRELKDEKFLACVPDDHELDTDAEADALMRAEDEAN